MPGCEAFSVSSRWRSSALATLFPGLAATGQEYGLSNKQRARIAIYEQENPNGANQIESNWRSLSAAQETNLLDRLALRELVADAEGLVLRAGHDVDGQSLVEEYKNNIVNKAIAEEAVAWEQCFAIAAEFTLRVATHPRPAPTRSSPTICFEGWTQAGEAVERFKYWGLTERFDDRVYQQYRDRLQQVDPTNYAYYLAFAALFAGLGEWEAAAALSAFAREVSLRVPEHERRGANGREAAFLEASCRRHLATGPQDLARSAELLAEAKRIMARETREMEDPLAIVPERFELEELDIDQMRLLFRWHDAGDTPVTSDFSAEVSYLLSTYGNLQRSLATQLDSLRGLFPDVEMALGSVSHVILQTEIRTILSALTLFSLDLSRPVGGEVDRIFAMLLRLDSLVRWANGARGAAKLAPEQSFFSSIVVPISQAIVTRHGRRVPGDSPNLTKTESALARDKLGARIQYIFDEKRFSRMREVVFDLRSRR